MRKFLCASQKVRTLASISFTNPSQKKYGWLKDMKLYMLLGFEKGVGLDHTYIIKSLASLSIPFESTLTSAKNSGTLYEEAIVLRATAYNRHYSALCKEVHDYLF